MQIDLSELLTHQGKEKIIDVPLEMEYFTCKRGRYEISSDAPMVFKFINTGGKKILVQADFSVSVIMPCDRCLENQENPITINTSVEVDLSETELERKEALNEMDYVNGTKFDAERFAYGEILVNLPMKVLCSENCKGICNRCGTNLNHNTCGCDTTDLDPRMAKALEVFNSFKEV